MPHVVVHEPGRVTLSLPLGESLRIGRDARNDLVLTDGKVSRQHAEIVRSGTGFTVADLGSTHGVLVNGRKVERQQLTDGDKIQIGNTLLELAMRDRAAEIVGGRATLKGPPPARGGNEADRLRLVYELAGAIGDAGDADDLLGRMLDTILDVLGCERAVAGLVDPAGGLRRVARARRPGEIVLSRALLDAMLARRESVLVRGDEESAPVSLVEQRLLSAAGAPLIAGDTLLGFIYVDDRRRALGGDDLDFLIALAHLTAAALDADQRRRRAASAAAALSELQRPGQILGDSEPMQRLVAQLHKVARAEGSNVLIHGESGTGKELVAQTLHAASPRADEPFVALNCAAIPDTMVESELFGHEKGAFTGAIKAKRGRFVLADRGTLFLDEIGDLSLAAQAKLLRAIEEGEVQPLGGERTLRVDCRVVAATHKDLHAEVAARRFREDLYYRLAVVEITAPPLRERGDDVAVLALAFLAQVAPRIGKRIHGVSAAALAAFRRYPWPGNVRELRNEVERAAIVAEGALIDLADLSARVTAAPAPAPAERSATLAEQLAALEPTEKRLVAEAMAQAGGNVSEAARLLGITRVVLRRRLGRLGGKA